MNLSPLVNRPIRVPWFKRVLQAAAFFGAYLIFAVVGSVASAACLAPAAVLRGVRAHRTGQRLIHGLFVFFVSYLRCCGLLKLDASELSVLRDSRGVILVANHPCLLDAVLVVSQLPQVVCLMKGSLARNIVLCGTAYLAGYVHNESGLGLVRKCEQRLRQGANLLIFPEGTRSIGGQMHPFKMGFCAHRQPGAVACSNYNHHRRQQLSWQGLAVFQKAVVSSAIFIALGKAVRSGSRLGCKKSRRGDRELFSQYSSKTHRACHESRAQPSTTQLMARARP